MPDTAALPSRERPRLVDFHSHYFAAAWPQAPPPAGSALARAWPLLIDLEAQLADLERAGVDAKVLSAPPSLLAVPGQPLAGGLMQHVNDRFAALVADHPGRLLALATVDAFQGDAAAREVERVATALGMCGICVDCAQGNRYLDAPAARATLEAAAAFDMMVFVHPVNPPGLVERLAHLGHVGTLLARGTEDAASVLALLRSGTLDDLPKLRLVIPMIGVAALIFAGLAQEERSREEGWRGTLPGVARQRLYIDTMGFDPATIRFAVDLLGPNQVLFGSDWPIMPIVSRERAGATLEAAGLSKHQQAAVLGENTVRLLTRQAV